jgi:hypothetical protein
MRAGFFLTLCDQIPRFEPLLRRTPGARFLVPPGRWPSSHRDSRAEIIRRLHASGLAPVISPAPDFDLVVAGAEAPEPTVRAWLRPRGTRVLWRDADAPLPFFAPSLTLCAGEALLPSTPGALARAVGDPLLDEASRPTTRARARHRLGLAQPGSRPLILVHGEHGRRGLEALSPALAALRIEGDLLLSCSELRRLERPQAFPRVLQGPGILPTSGLLSPAEALAACDLVLAEPGVLALQAAALGRTTLLLGSRHELRTVSEAPSPAQRALEGMYWVEDRHALSEQLAWALGDAHDYREEARSRAEEVVGVMDGGATGRAVAALQLLAAGDEALRAGSPA